VIRRKNQGRLIQSENPEPVGAPGSDVIV
jgi:hypothetical protein